MSVIVHCVHNNIVLHIAIPCCLFGCDFQPWLTMLFPVPLSHVWRACTALSKRGVGVGPTSRTAAVLVQGGGGEV